MDFLNDYGDDDDDQQVTNEAKAVEPIAEEVEQGDKEEIPEYEDFNVDYHHESDQKSASESDSDSDDDYYGPQPAPANEQSAFEQRDGNDEDNAVQQTAEERFDDYVSKHKIPVACEVSIGGHNRAVTAVSVEPAGNRFVTGSLDYCVKLYDFGGMDSRHRAFASIEAQDGHPVMSIAHSPNGDRFLVGTASSQPTVYDRDGREIIGFCKGDMYLRDLAHTKGHTMSVTCVQWHPTEKNLVMTSSLDGTVRLWDLLGEASFGKLNNLLVLKPSQDKSIVSAMSTAHSHGSGGGANGAVTRTAVTSCVFAPTTGNRIYAGLSNGNIVSWQHQTGSSGASSRRRYHYAALPSVLTDPYTSTAAKSGDEHAILSLTMSPNEELLAARYANGVVLVWDVKNKRVVQRCLHLAHGSYTTANVAFSADSLRFAGCALMPFSEEEHTASSSDANKETEGAPKKKPLWGKPRLMVFDAIARSSPLSSSSSSSSSASAADAVVSEKILRQGATPALAITIGEVGQVGIFCRWHRSTNQLFVTMSHGETKVFFDASMIPGDNPRKGAVLSSQRAPKRAKDPTDFAIVGDIINPLALPMYRTDNHPSNQRKRKVQDLKDPSIAKIPDMPVKQGPGSRPNNSFFFTKYVMDTHDGKQQKDIRSEDPREALLKYADMTKDDPRFLGRAYATSQPKALLADTTFEEEQEQFKKRQKTL